MTALETLIAKWEFITGGTAPENLKNYLNTELSKRNGDTDKTLTDIVYQYAFNMQVSSAPTQLSELVCAQGVNPDTNIESWKSLVWKYGYNVIADAITAYHGDYNAIVGAYPLTVTETNLPSVNNSVTASVDFKKIVMYAGIAYLGYVLLKEVSKSR